LAVKELNETGVVVTNICCDNAASNISMLNKLGAKMIDPENLKPTIDLTNAEGESIFVVLDTSHLIKVKIIIIIIFSMFTL